MHGASREPRPRSGRGRYGSAALAIALLGVGALASPGAAVTDRCAGKDRRAELQDTRVRIYSVTAPDNSERYYACYRPNGRSMFLAKDGIDYFPGGFRIRGRFVKYEWANSKHDSVLEVTVADVLERRAISTWIFGRSENGGRPSQSLEVSGERLRGDGAYAFLVSGVGPTTDPYQQVHRGHGTRQVLLDSSKHIDPASFAATDREIRWRNNGEQRVAPFH